MKITVLGAGNSGLAMAAHLSNAGYDVTLWNRSKATIEKLLATRTIVCSGMIEGYIRIPFVTNNIGEALIDADVILITTPASAHRELAEKIAKNINKEALIVLNPGRTFGALEFQEVYQTYNPYIPITVAETQTNLYTCRKTGEDSVEIINIKSGVLISTFDANENDDIIRRLPQCLQQYFTPAESMIETSLGNVGMILHCAPLLLNTGWTESIDTVYKYYYEGITPTVARFIEKVDKERVVVARHLGMEVETTQEWLERTYLVTGRNLYEAIQNNHYYTTIDAPVSMRHRYIFEDVPCGLVPLEAVGQKLGLPMTNTKLVIDLASSLMEVDFRRTGRNLNEFFINGGLERLKVIFTRREFSWVL